MFDSKQFISEVRNRVCLWDSREKPDRMAKKRAWEEVARIMFKSWDNEIETKQRQLVDELQKKWKHLRDYYVKEKKLESKCGATPKKRKCSYVDCLQFLDVVKENRVSLSISSPVDNANSCDESTAQRNITENYGTDEPGTSQNKNIPKTIHQQKSNLTKPPKDEEDADTKFLLSLLPLIKSLNERHNCEFRMEVMNLIYKLKYRNSYTMGSGNNNYSYTYEPRRYTDGSDTHVDQTISTSLRSKSVDPLETQGHASDESEHSIEANDQVFVKTDPD